MLASLLSTAIVRRLQLLAAYLGCLPWVLAFAREGATYIFGRIKRAIAQCFSRSSHSPLE
jgi:hypothetical protein